MTEPEVRLVVRRVIAASPQRLFLAWTTPSQLQAWWGPPGGRCAHAELDARAGGRYRIDNQLADGQVVSITGEFLLVEAPGKIVYTWRIEPGGPAAELVTVTFQPTSAGTEVTVLHERIAGQRTRQEHEQGWIACLDRLTAYAARAVIPEATGAKAQ